MSEVLKELLKNIEESQKQINTLTKAVIYRAEEDLKGSVSFKSTQDYDDNNFYSHVTLSYIDNIYFDEYYVMALDEEEILLLFNEAKADPKNKVKELLLLNNEELEELSIEDRVIFYCLKKKITPTVFFSAFKALVEIKHLHLPEDKVEFA